MVKRSRLIPRSVHSCSCWIGWNLLAVLHNWQGVYPMVDDPNLDILPDHSRPRVASMTFARIYHKVLNALNETFNGNTDKITVRAARY